MSCNLGRGGLKTLTAQGYTKFVKCHSGFVYVVRTLLVLRLLCRNKQDIKEVCVCVLLLMWGILDLGWMRHTAVSQKTSPICNLMRILDSQRGCHAHEMAHEGKFLYQLHLPGTHCVGSWRCVFYSSKLSHDEAIGLLTNLPG